RNSAGVAWINARSAPATRVGRTLRLTLWKKTWINRARQCLRMIKTMATPTTTWMRRTFPHTPTRWPSFAGFLRGCRRTSLDVRLLRKRPSTNALFARTPQTHATTTSPAQRTSSTIRLRKRRRLCSS
ncbi:unnamed protein product, partial [Ectocarpus sp. 12 AP-2014]